MGLSFHSAMARCSSRSPGEISVPTEYLRGCRVWGGGRGEAHTQSNGWVIDAISSSDAHKRWKKGRLTHQPITSASLFTAAWSSRFSFTYAGGILSAPSGPTSYCSSKASVMLTRSLRGWGRRGQHGRYVRRGRRQETSQADTIHTQGAVQGPTQ